MEPNFSFFKLRISAGLVSYAAKRGGRAYNERLNERDDFDEVIEEDAIHIAATTE